METATATNSLNETNHANAVLRPDLARLGARLAASAPFRSGPVHFGALQARFAARARAAPGVGLTARRSPPGTAPRTSASAASARSSERERNGSMNASANTAGSANLGELNDGGFVEGHRGTHSILAQCVLEPP